MATTKIESDRTFRDLDLNFTIHPVKKDINTFKDEFAIINSVKNLILTNYYERLFQPTISLSIEAATKLSIGSNKRPRKPLPIVG